MSAFLLYVQSSEEIIGNDEWFKKLFDELSSGYETIDSIGWPYTEGSQIKDGDLIIVMEKGQFWPLLVGIGKTVSDYQHVTYGKHNGHIIDIHFDFLQGEHKDFTGYSTLLKESGIDLYKLKRTEIQLPEEVTEKLIKRFAVVHMACPRPHSSFAFNPKRDKKQLLCNYLNEYCPEFRKEIIKRFPLEYKNYKEGEVIDKDLIDLTYDKSVTSFPGACLDWNLLFDIIRPRA